MARRSSQAKISLFPFLAVLVCTMGALILLLLVTTRRMNQNQAAAAAAVAVQSSQDAIGSFPQPLTEDAFIVSLEETRQQSAIAKANAVSQAPLSIALLPPAPISKAAQAEKHQRIQQLQTELDSEQLRHTELLQQIQIVRARLQNQSSDDSQYASQMQELSQLKAQHAQLDQQLQTRELELAQLREVLDRDSESVEDAESLLKARESALLNLRKLVQDIPEEGVAGTDQTIVEFTNSTGTHRSPILLDVSEGGFTFLPSKVRITDQDMDGFPGNDNPLLAGVLAIHEHRHAQSATVKPYVLLLVRPDGSMPFYAAQRTLNDAGIHFGYELLEQDRKIASGRSQAAEAAALRQAILAALNRRETLYRGMIAEVEQLKESLAARRAAQAGERAVQMTPDGRLLMPDEQGSTNEALFAAENQGRFYAGGQAPPPGSLTRRNDLSNHNTLPESGTVSSAAEAKSPLPDSTSPAVSASVEPHEPEAVIAQAFPAFPQTGSAPPNALESSTSHLSVDMEPGGFGTTPSDAEQNAPELNSSAAQMPTENNSEADWNQLRNSLRTSPDLYGNLGVPVQSVNEAGAAASSATGDARPYLQAQPSLTDYPREPTGWSDSGTAPANLTPRTVSPAQEISPAQPAFSADLVLNPAADKDSSGSVRGSGRSPSTDSESFLQKFMQRVEEVKGQRAPDPMLVQLLNRGWQRTDSEREFPNDGADADADRDAPPSDTNEEAIDWQDSLRDQPVSETRPAWGSEFDSDATLTPAESPFHPNQQEDRPQTSPSFSATQPHSATASEAWPAALISVTQAKESERVGAAERSQAYVGFPEDTRRSQNATSQPTTDTTASPSVTTPPRTQQVYYVIRVFIEPEQLTIGDYEAVSTASWDADQRLAMTLEVISATMEEVWSSVRRDALPAVRFLVAPGAESLQANLSQQLAAMQIPTRGVLKLSSEMTADRFFSDEPLPGQAVTSPSPSNSVSGSAESMTSGSGQISKGSR